MDVLNELENISKEYSKFFKHFNIIDNNNNNNNNTNSFQKIDYYIELITFENERLNITVNSQGWYLINYQKDNNNNFKIFETFESLLMLKSVKFNEKFHNDLFTKLMSINAKD